MVALAGICGAGGGAQAQQYFAIDRPDVELESIVEYETEDRVTRGRPRTQDTLTFREKADIGTHGWVYHPALAIYSLDLRPEFKVQRREVDGDLQNEDQLIFFGYAIDTTFLQYKPYTLNLFSSRDRSEFSSTLSGDTITETAVDRAQLFLKYQPVPTTITAEHRQTEHENFIDFSDSTLTGRIESRHETEASRSRFRTEFTRQEREFATRSFTSDRVLSSVNNNYRFSDDLSLFSGVFGNLTTSADNDSLNLNLSEHLFWDISDDLRSDYQFNYDVREEDDFSSRTAVGRSTFRHQLYENLETTFSAEGSDEDFTNGAIRKYQSSLSFAYHRRIPWGTVGLTNGYSVALENSDTDPAFRDVRDESVSLSGTSLVFLENEDIDVASIVVTDSSGLIIFAENTDYIISQFDRSLAIQRVGVGSTIPDGATVLVDYRFQSQGPFELYNTGIRAGGTLRLFDSLRLFYDYFTAEDHLISGNPPGTLTDDTIHRMGAEYTYRWSTTEVEYEIRDTTRVPYNRLTVREALSFRPARRLSIGLGGGFSHTELTDTSEESTQTSATVTAQWQPFRWGHFALDGFARRTRGDVQETDDIGLRSRFRWRWGAWGGRVEYEFAHRENFESDQEQNRHSVLVSVIRRF